MKDEHKKVLVDHELFGEIIVPYRQVFVRQTFSFDKNVAPKKEHEYRMFSKYINDENLEEIHFEGSATLAILPLLREVRNAELVKAVKDQNILATLSVLHEELKKDKDFLGQKIPQILIPAPSKNCDEGGQFCVSFSLFNEDHYINSSWLAQNLSHNEKAPVLVAVLFR